MYNSYLFVSIMKILTDFCEMVETGMDRDNNGEIKK